MRVSFVSIAAAAFVSLSPAAAFAASGSYVAGFAAPVTQPKLVSSERVWTCSDSVCAAKGASSSPPQHISSRLPHEMATLTPFTAPGEACSAAQQAACHALATTTYPQRVWPFVTGWVVG